MKLTKYLPILMMTMLPAPMALAQNPQAAAAEEAAKAACKAKSDPSILLNYWKTTGVAGTAAELERRAKAICVTIGGGGSRSYAISGNAGPMKVSGTICSLLKPFTVSGGGGGMTVTFSYAPAGQTGGKVSYTGGAPGIPMSGAGTYSVTLNGTGGTIKQTHSGKVNIPMGGSATHTDVLTLTTIPKC